MLIESVTVRDFATLSGPVTVPFREGVNLVHGPNESGKSPLMAAVWAGLTLRATTTGQRIESFRPRSGGIPTVSIRFQHDECAYTLTKVFKGTRGTTHLTIDAGSGEVTELSGDDAEIALRAALGLDQSVLRARASDHHLGIWPMVWVRQGHSGLSPSQELHESGRRELGERLSSLAGEVLAGSGAERIFEGAKAEYLRYYSEKTGRESERADSPLKQARDRAAVAESALDELCRKCTAYDEALASHRVAEAEVGRLTAELPEAEALSSTAASKLDAVRALRNRHDAATAALDAAKQRVLLAEQAQRTRVSSRAALIALDEADAKATAHRDGAQQLIASHTSQREPLERAVERKEASVRSSQRMLVRVRTHLDAMRTKEALRAAQAKLAQAHEERATLEEITAQRDALKISPEAIQELERLARDVDHANAALESAAVEVRIRALDMVGLALGDEEESLTPGEHRVRRVVEPLVARIGDVAEIEIVPAGSAFGGLRGRAEQARKALKKRMAALGVKKLTGARRLEEAHRRFAVQIDVQERLLAGVDFDALEAEVVALTQRANEATERYEAACDDGDETLPTELGSAVMSLRDAEEALDAARRAAEASRAAVVAHDADGARVSAEHAMSLTQLEASAAKRTELTAQLERSVAELGDDQALDKAVADALEASQQAATALSEVNETLASGEANRLESEAAGATEALERAREALVRQREDMVGLEGELRSADLIGLHSRLSGAQAEHDAASDELRRVEQRALAAKHLFETLDRCRTEARDPYREPLRKAVEPLLALLFPEGGVLFDEQFDFQQLNRPGAVDAFDDLSAGAREQVALVVRLGMAQVLAGDGVLPVILDDSLVSTDDARLARMARVLDCVGKRLQLIVLTCHWDRFRAAGIRADHVIDLPSLKRDAEQPAETQPPSTTLQ